MERVKVKLISEDPSSYPDRIIEIDKIDLVTESDSYTSKEVITAVKTATVQVRPAKEGDVIETNPRCIYEGKIYRFTEITKPITKEIVDNGGKYIINPDHEIYVIKNSATYGSKYKDNGDGTAMPKDKPRQLRKITKSFAAALWGDTFVFPEGSYVMLKDDGEIDYGITNAAFEATYSTDPKEIQARIDYLAEEAKNSVKQNN